MYCNNYSRHEDYKKGFGHHRHMIWYPVFLVCLLKVHSRTAGESHCADCTGLDLGDRRVGFRTNAIIIGVVGGGGWFSLGSLPGSTH